MQSIEQRRTAWTVTDLGLFGDKLGVLQHGQVLTYSIVIEPHIRGHFCHAHGSFGVGYVAEQAMTSRVSECPCFALDVCHVHVSSYEAFLGFPVKVLVYTGITNTKPYGVATSRRTSQNLHICDTAVKRRHCPAHAGAVALGNA